MTSFFSNIGLSGNLFSGYQTSQPLEASTRRLSSSSVGTVNIASAPTVTQYRQAVPQPKLSRTQLSPRQKVETVQVAAPLATVGVDTNHDGKANYYYTGVDRNHDGIPDALQVPHAVPHVYVQGVPIPLYEVHHFRTMSAETLSVHANHVYRTLGPATLKAPVPTERTRLVEWLLDVHDGHLIPLRQQAIPHSVPCTYVKGVPMPSYEVHHLRTMAPSQLRAHANHVAKTISPSKPVPDQDHALLDWLVEMHESHISEHVRKLKELESMQTPAINDILNHVVPHVVPHILLEGTPVPLYEAHHLRAMPLPAVRAHARHLYKVFGYRMRTPVPTSDNLLIDWVTEVHAAHIQPLRHQALQHSVGHVYYGGVPIPLYEAHHLRTMEISHLRLHATHLAQSIRAIRKPIPSQDSLLIEWIIEMHELHLKDHATKLRLTSTSPSRRTSPTPLGSRKEVHHVVPHAVRHILFQGVPIPYYEVHHLRAMSVDAVRVHAHYLYKTIGLRTPVPESDHLLIEWVVEAHNNHLHPLRDQALQHSVPHVYYSGVPLPLYEPHHLRAMTVTQLRSHATHLYKTISVISKPIPTSDELLLEWLIEMHELHMLEHKKQMDTSGCGNSQTCFYGSVRRETIEPWMVAQEAAKLKDLQKMSDIDLQHIIMDSLVAHGLKATASALRRECELDHSEFPLNVEKKEPLVPPDMPTVVAEKFAEARDVNNKQHHIIEECSEQVTQQRGRLEKLLERLQAMRANCSSSGAEEQAALARLQEQDSRIEELKLSSNAFERIEAEVKENIQLQSAEKRRLAEVLSTRDANIQLLQEQIKVAEAQLEELKQKYENSDANQAQRIKHLLLNWDSPHGPKRVASETFSHVDTNHDGRLEWATDEVCRFVRLLFHYHNITAPPWADGVWYELYRLCDLDKSHSLDIGEALRFARGCFEAALRMLSGV